MGACGQGTLVYTARNPGRQQYIEHDRRPRARLLAFEVLLGQTEALARPRRGGVPLRVVLGDERLVEIEEDSPGY